LSRGFSNFFEIFSSRLSRERAVPALVMLGSYLSRPLTIIIILFFVGKSIGFLKVIFLTILIARANFTTLKW
jgi:hypothetical protein